MSDNVKLTPFEKVMRLIQFDKDLCDGALCGVDEAGRGPLAGPVSVCACSMPLDAPIVGIDDSKKLSEKKREALYEQIVEIADYCVVLIDRETIDSINILQATKLGMSRAVRGLKNKPNKALVDAVTKLDLDISYDAIIKGDAKSYNIAAASIIAKVTRDRYMRELDAEYPMYGFAKNKGYGTAEHIAALGKYGPCAEHRRTFIKNFVSIENAEA